MVVNLAGSLEAQMAAKKDAMTAGDWVVEKADLLVGQWEYKMVV